MAWMVITLGMLADEDKAALYMTIYLADVKFCHGELLQLAN